MRIWDSTVVALDPTNRAALDRSNGTLVRNAANGANTNATTTKQTQNPGYIRNTRLKANCVSDKRILEPVIRYPEITKNPATAHNPRFRSPMLGSAPKPPR